MGRYFGTFKARRMVIGAVSLWGPKRITRTALSSFAPLTPRAIRRVEARLVTSSCSRRTWIPPLVFQE